MPTGQQFNAYRYGFLLMYIVGFIFVPVTHTVAQKNLPFHALSSFPVSEATWAEKAADLYLVAAQRCVLVFRKVGPADTDYGQVNRIFPGLDGNIENMIVTSSRLYLPASAHGLLAYRLTDIEKPDVQPEWRSTAGKRLGMISLAGRRIYARCQDCASAGIAVFDANTLALLGEGLAGMPLYGLTASSSHFVYASSTAHYAEMLVIDARNPTDIRIVNRLTHSPYATFFRWPASMVDDRLYIAESNGGVGVYDITDPAGPALQYRYAAMGPAVPGRNQPGTIRAFVTDGVTGYLVSERFVKAVKIGPDSMQQRGIVHTAELNGGGLSFPSAISLRDGIIGLPTTVEGARFYDVTDTLQPKSVLNVDLPSRIEGLAKVGRMLYVTSDIDGVWQLDWQAPMGPQALQRIPLKGLSEDLLLYRQWLYVANGVGLAVLDIANPQNPCLVNYWDFPYPGGTPNINHGWVEGVEQSDGFLYAALGPAGLAVFSLQHPEQPELIHLMSVNSGAWGHDLSVHPGRKLLAYSGGSRLVLMSLEDKALPWPVADITLPDNKPTSGNTFSPDGNYLIVCQAGQFSIFQVSVNHELTLLKTVYGHGAEGVLFYDRYLLVSGYGSGTGVWRIGDVITDLALVQKLPSYFYNSKFFVEGNHIFTNAEGVDEYAFQLDTRTASRQERGQFDFTLQPNAPNPFNASTCISYTLHSVNKVSLDIVSCRGENVRSLVHERQMCGLHQSHWDGRDASGRAVASGVYLCRLQTDRQTQVRKTLLVK